eukprot:jgi/Tetstr1/435117/TSEL_024085.t1
MVAQHQAMDKESRGRTMSNLIRTFSPKMRVQILLADVRVVTRRPPKPAAADPAGPSGTMLPTTAMFIIMSDRRHRHADPMDWSGVYCPQNRPGIFRCALTARATCNGPLADLDMLTVEHLIEAIAATINHCINTPPELLQASWLTDTMKAANVDMKQHHTEPKVHEGDDNLCAISLGKEDEEFAATMRLAVALTSPVALLRVVRVRTIVIYLNESEFSPSELHMHPFSHTPGEAGRLGGNNGHNHLCYTALGLRKKARKTPIIPHPPS